MTCNVGHACLELCQSKRPGKCHNSLLPVMEDACITTLSAQGDHGRQVRAATYRDGGIFTFLPTTPLTFRAMRTMTPMQTSASRLSRHLRQAAQPVILSQAQMMKLAVVVVGDCTALTGQDWGGEGRRTCQWPCCG